MRGQEVAMRYQLLDAPVVVVRMTGEVMVVGQDGVTRPVQLGDRLPAGGGDAGNGCRGRQQLIRAGYFCRC